MSSAGDHIRLETTGRVSGHPHSVLVRYVMNDGKIVVFPQNRDHQDWVANLERNPSVSVYGAGQALKGVARVKKVSGLKDPLLGIFTRKYGENEVRKRYWGQLRYVEIELISQSNASDYRELYYADLETAFDGVAEHYDDHILGNEMNLWLRNRSTNLLTRLFHPGETVLEVGCGTGTETLQLAKNGTTVIASDISSKMLDVLSRKAHEMGLENRVVPVHVRPYKLKEKLHELGYDRVDGAYSTYGAINTEPDIVPLIEVLHSVIRPQGTLLLGVWNKYCLYEIVGYSIRMSPTMTVARLRNPVPVGKSRFCVASMAYSVGSLSKSISGFFRLEKVYGVEILLPPSNLTRYLPSGGVLELVKKVELTIESRYPWNRLGDHFLGVYSRVE